MAQLTHLPIPTLVRELGEGFKGITFMVTDPETRDKVIGYVNRNGGPSRYRVTPLLPRTDLATTPV